MFEKESQDYAMREVAPRQELYIKGRADIDTDYEKVKKIWQDGAEFGYNKANEWHYVKDGKDLPKEIKEYLVYKIDGYGCKSIQVMQFNNQHCWCANCQNDIKAWKEIVLPKESE